MMKVAEKTVSPRERSPIALPPDSRSRNPPPECPRRNR
jgi:hypothetical protein